MPDPKLEEFTRARDLQHHIFRNMQQYVRDIVQPRLDERDRLIEENAALTEEVRDLKKKLAGRTRTAEREQAAVS